MVELTLLILSFDFTLADTQKLCCPFLSSTTTTRVYEQSALVMCYRGESTCCISLKSNFLKTFDFLANFNQS